MTTSSLSLSVFAVAGVLALSACSTEATPSAAPSASAPAPDSADPSGIVAAQAVLEVDDQVSQGPTVNVKAAAVPEGGWVVVAADGGRNVLGYGQVPKGTAPQLVQVSLAEVITKDTELVARLYDEANPDGLYGAGDKPVGNDQKDEDDLAGGESETFTFRGADVVNS